MSQDLQNINLRKIHFNIIEYENSNSKTSNEVSTTKYSYFSFIFKFLFEQFKKYANVFFLITCIIQQIPGVSPTSTSSTIIPFSIVLLFSGLKEIYEDRKRAEQDAEANNRFAKVVVTGSDIARFHETQCKWKDLRVGDLVVVYSGEFFPADLILLSSSESEGLCYIETSSLDGETNLKIRQSSEETMDLNFDNISTKLKNVYFESELPNENLYSYEALLHIGNQKVPLSTRQLLPRGALLKNTRFIFGVVAYTGHETKLLLNATSAPIKRTRVEKQTNSIMLILLFILLSMALFSSFAFSIFTLSNSSNLSYLYLSSSEVWKTTGFNILTFLVLYNNLIPISLIITMEVVKLVLAYFVSQDLDMYYGITDTPAQAKTSSVIEELGQIQYIFSDKTGTLTRNEMEFRECCIDGIPFSENGTKLDVKENFDMNYDQFISSYKSNIPKGTRFDFMRLSQDLASSGPNSSLFRQFFTIMSTCHTVIPEISDSQKAYSDISYQASSPDEIALIKGAQKLMYMFHTRKQKSIVVNIRGNDEEFDIIAVNEFNSTRKRMSVVLRSKDSSSSNAFLFVKGAENVILERLKGTDRKEASNNLSMMLQILEEYANEGLRTLCFACKELREDELKDWMTKYQKASTIINDRQTFLDNLAEEIEKDLVLIGVTGVEDKLQDGVPDTIYELGRAGIKLWVLTGDRQETAINIGYSCKLLREKMKIMILNEETMESTRDSLVRKLKDIKLLSNKYGIRFPDEDYDFERPKKGLREEILELFKTFRYNAGLNAFERSSLLRNLDESEAESVDHNSLQFDSFGLVVDGKTLKYCLNEKDQKMRELFLSLSTKCHSVICCRVSPLQKAQIVRLVKKKLDAVSLAIGDGANDVGMIQAASIGVGINGHEGLQAARSSDFAISQFRFLKKLILVHGTWSYIRLSRLILFSFYKNMTLYLTQFWFSFFNGFSGQTIYESWILSIYNVIFTVLPPFAIGVFDQILTAGMLEKFPEIYNLGRKNELFNLVTFFGWFGNAVYQSALLYFLISFNFNEVLAFSPYEGNNEGLFYLGLVIFTSVLVTVLLKAAITTDHWTNIAWVFIPGSFFLWLIVFPTYSQIAPFLTNPDSKALSGILSPLFLNANYWFTAIVVPFICILRDIIWKYFKRQNLARNYHIVQEIQKFNIPDYRPHQFDYSATMTKVIQIQNRRRESLGGWTEAGSSIELNRFNDSD